MSDPAARLDATEAQIDAFVARLQLFYERNLQKIVSNLRKIKNPDAVQRGLEAAQMLGRLQSVLDEQGLSAQLAPLRKIYAAQLTDISKLFARKGEGAQIYTDADKALVENLIVFDSQKVSKTLENYTADVRATMMTTVLGGDADSLVDTVAARTDGMGSRLSTDLNTMVQGFHRSVTTAKAKELGYELYEYVGPLDRVTRPFCEDLLEKDPPIYTAEQIKGMSNGQDLDVWTYCGGYNCRHEWQPVTEDEAREAGWNG